MKALLKREMTLRRQRQQTEAGPSTTTPVPPPVLTVTTASEVICSPPSPFSSPPHHPPPPPFSSTTTSPPILPFSSEFPSQSLTPNASLKSSPLVSPPSATSSPRAYPKLQEEGGTAFYSSSSPPYSSPLFPIPLSGEADLPLRMSPSSFFSPHPHIFSLTAYLCYCFIFSPGFPSPIVPFFIGFYGLSFPRISFPLFPGCLCAKPGNYSFRGPLSTRLFSNTVFTTPS